MAMEIGNREKKFVGVIALAFTIAALHMLVFRDSNREFVEARNLYEAAIASTELETTPTNWQNKRPEYEKKTEEIRAQLQKLIEPIGLGEIPPALGSLVLSKPDVSAVEDYQKTEILKWPKEKVEYLTKAWPNFRNYFEYKGEDEIVATLAADLASLQDFAKKNPDLGAFIHEGAAPGWGWELPEQLPANIRKGVPNLKDLIDDIVNDNRFVYNLDLKSARGTVEGKQLSYQTNMEILTETSIAEWEEIRNNLKQPVFDLKMLSHLNLIAKELDKSGPHLFPPAALRRAFRINLPTYASFYVHRQLVELRKMLDLAKADNIEKIAAVALYPQHDILYDEKWFEVPEETPEGATTPIGATPTPLVPMKGLGGGEGYGYGGFGGYGYGGFGGYGYGGYGYGGYGGTPTPETQIRFGGAGPVQLTVSGDNQNVTRFLYDLANSPRMYEIDELMVWGDTTSKSTAAKVWATVRVTVIGESEYVLP